MRSFAWPPIALVAALGTCAPCAHADDGHAKVKKRALPDYDGRGTAPKTHDNAGTWLARVLLSPLYFLSEYAIRRPASALTQGAENRDYTNDVYNVFAFGPHHNIGFLPIGFVEFGFNPSVGVYFFGDDLVVKHNHVRLHLEMWPTDWYGASLRDRYDVGKTSELELHLSAISRPDMVFYGIGPRTLQSQQSRYDERRFDARASFDSRVWRSSHVAGGIGVRKVIVTDGHYGSDPNVSQEAALGAFSVPFGFGDTYVAPYATVHVALDTRREGQRRGSSFHVEANAEEGADMQRAPSTSWLRWGGSATASIDVDGHARILSFSAAALFADSLDHQPIPFTELVSLGGDTWMRGYFPGRLVDRSAAVASVEYRWPIAPLVDAIAEAAVGNVFDEHLQDFSPGLLRLSGALGLTTPLADPPIELLVGFGTETFDHGAQVDSVRVTVGVPRSF
ncbi:MAG TPA: hypothetical protein VGH28_07905 [Polyangiaceae bacterium]|jgi:hypothetical protein